MWSGFPLKRFLQLLLESGLKEQSLEAESPGRNPGERK